MQLWLPVVATHRLPSADEATFDQLELGADVVVQVTPKSLDIMAL